MIQELGSSLIPVLAITCSFLFFTIWVICATIDSLHKTSSTNRLKERLIDRGISAADIDQIIKAGQTSMMEEVAGANAASTVQASRSATRPVAPVKSFG